ncbi:hypothetical protein BCR33DRAFT_544797 [Rhizoclosmatium globosum]|uniref:Uncharacterized protein n=1 Tax=Rhizoclosmatium globosum TaxID=329046 RepID=A0A1Y2B9K7_9FUNG|nr:hypothetical protein BCR33DRAFT_544797 [Rhizoclosmatium globosum]|eukprot:ORY31551.1 hypothetical protein BCR33DRAFT_544797 [Rhizoclosmatium globosum]
MNSASQDPIEEVRTDGQDLEALFVRDVQLIPISPVPEEIITSFPQPDSPQPRLARTQSTKGSILKLPLSDVSPLPTSRRPSFQFALKGPGPKRFSMSAESTTSRVKKSISFSMMKADSESESSDEDSLVEGETQEAVGKGSELEYDLQNREGDNNHSQIPKERGRSILSTQIYSALTVESQVSGFSKTASQIRSKRSSQSSREEDTMFGRMMRFKERTRTQILESEEYRIYRMIMDNAKYQILFLGACQGLILASIALVIQVVLNHQLPSIRFYNLVHAAVSFQGKLLLMLGWELCHLVRKGFAAIEMQSSKRGVPLTHISNVNPASCRPVNRIFMSCLLFVEVGLWITSYMMDWIPVDTYLGTYPCTLPTYRIPWNFTNNLPLWAAANTEMAVLESVGLPLATGIIGGITASPNAAPGRNFQLNGPGLAYLVEAVCADPVVVYGPNSTVTTSKILSSQYWGAIYTVGIEIRMPAGSHNMFQYSQYDITQNCQANIVTGDATVTFTYTSDEWGSFTAGYIQDVNINNQLFLDSQSSFTTDFGAIHNAFGNTTFKQESITKWISQAVEMVFESDDMQNPANRILGASLNLWGQDLNGFNDPPSTWKGIATGIGVLAHYVLLQSDNTDITKCIYKGNEFSELFY